MINIEKPESIGYQSSIEKGFDVLEEFYKGGPGSGIRGHVTAKKRNVAANKVINSNSHTGFFSPDSMSTIAKEYGGFRKQGQHYVKHVGFKPEERLYQGKNYRTNLFTVLSAKTGGTHISFLAKESGPGAKSDLQPITDKKTKKAMYAEMLIDKSNW